MASAPRRVAFLDLDGSILEVNSFHQWAWYLARHVPRSWLPLSLAYGRRALKLASSDYLRAGAVKPFAGRPESEMRDLVDRFVQDVLMRRLRPGARAFLDDLAARKYQRILLTGALQPIAESVANQLGLEGALGTRVEVRDGIVTGRLDGPELRGAEKRRRVLSLQGPDCILSDCLGLGDSHEDLAFLELLGRRVLVNWRQATPPGDGWELVRWL